MGIDVGTRVLGTSVGFRVGLDDVGMAMGDSVGTEVVGKPVGSDDGLVDGASDGASVVGAAVDLNEVGPSVGSPES